MEPGCVVEYIDNQRMNCAVVLEIKMLRLRLLTENNREVKLSAGRISHRTDLHLDLSQPREKIALTLKEIAARRRQISEAINLQELWEVLNSEQELIDLATMTSLCFPAHADSDHESAVNRAFFNDRLYFKFSPEGFLPYSEEQVEQMRNQRETAQRFEALIENGSQWLQKTLKGQTATPPAERDELINIFSSYYLMEKESPHRETARAILKKAAISSDSALFTFLVKIGIWKQDENLDLLIYGINPDLPDAVQAQAQKICLQQAPPDTARRDLRDWPLLTIDGPSTLDFDDALSLSQEEDHYLLGIHITDVAHYIAKGDIIDQEALARASSIYTPDQRIPMLPVCLSEDTCSLKAGIERPAISTLIRMTAKAEIIDYDIVPSRICVQHQLTYQDADAMAENDPTIKALHTLACQYRNRRLDKAALIIELPEVAIWLNPDSTPALARFDRESPGRMLVSELMILANDISARFLSERKLPAIFRSQPEPRERLFNRDTGSLFQNWMQRKLINRFVLGSEPEPHAGLGLPAYVTGTSPIRKYSDLITQRQLLAALGYGEPYTKTEMDNLIAKLELPMGQVGRVQARRNRYWLLKYLEKLIGKKEEALVLNRRRDGYAIMLPNYMLECHLSGAENIKLKPEDLVQITIQHVNARNDVLTVYLG